MSESQPFIFLSYSRADNEFVTRLRMDLRAHGIKIWIDKEGIQPGDVEWDDALRRVIRDCQAVVLIVSSNAQSSSYIKGELRVAQEYERTIYPVWATGTKWVDCIPLLSLSGMQYIDARETQYAQALPQFVAALKAAIAQSQDSAQASKPEPAVEPRNPYKGLRAFTVDDAGDFFGREPVVEKLVDVVKSLAAENEVAFLHVSAPECRRSLVTAIVTVLLLVAMTGLMSCSFLAPADPTRVTNLQDNGVGSLRWAVVNAPSGSMIMFDRGLRGTIMLTSADMGISKNVTIRGPGPGILAISSGRSGHIVHVLQRVTSTISDLTFKDSYTDSGALIKDEGTLTLSNSTVSGNNGNIYNKGGTLTITNSTVSGNNGGIYNEHGTLTLTNSTVSGNTTGDSSGSGIYNGGTLTLINSMVTGNMIDSIHGYEDKGGGGIYNDHGAILTLTNSTISGNMAANGVYSNGGGIANEGTLTVTNSTISGNVANNLGGGIYNKGTLTVTNSTISGNIANMGGGGIANCVGLAICRNIESMANKGTFTITNSTVSDNTAPNGGGITNIGGKATITFSTVYGNNTTGKGGGLSIEDGQDNSGKKVPSQVSIGDSIIAGNRASTGPDISGTLTTDGYNLIQSFSGATFNDPLNKHASDIAGDKFANLGIDPMLRDNGGLATPHTFTHALSPDSPAFDYIPAAACNVNINGTVISTDQRGVKRPQGKGCDIGAYEYVYT